MEFVVEENYQIRRMETLEKEIANGYQLESK